MSHPEREQAGVPPAGLHPRPELCGVDEIPDRSDDACAPARGPVGRARLQRGDHPGRGSCCTDGGTEQPGDRHQHPVRTPADRAAKGVKHFLGWEFILLSAAPGAHQHRESLGRPGEAHAIHPLDFRTPGSSPRCAISRTRKLMGRLNAIENDFRQAHGLYPEWALPTIIFNRRFAPPILAQQVSCT